MNASNFRVAHIDHVEFFVPDQYEAAAWYHAVLGLEILPAYEHWASDGPLMISSDEGRTMLAVFRGQPQGDRPTAGFRRVAFRVDGAGFRAFLEHITTIDVRTLNGNRLTEGDVVDHGLSRSIYFRDPYGHPLEVTTYDDTGPTA